MRILIKTPIANDYKVVFSKFNLDLFKALKPPLTSLIVERFDGCKKGGEVHLIVSGQKWVSHITSDYEDETSIYFIDEGFIIPPPIKKWKHKHLILKTGDHQCVVIDDIYYTTGITLLDYLMYPILLAAFSFRKPVYVRELS